METMGSEVPAAPEAPVPVESGLAVKGLFQVFTAPTALFEKLKTQPKILVPYIVYWLLFAVIMVLLKDLIAEAQLQAMVDRGIELSSAQLEGMRKFAWVQPAAGSVVILFIPLMTAGLALFWGNVVFGGTGKFGQLLSVSLYAGIIFAAVSLVSSVLAVAKGSLAVSLSPAVLVASRGIQDPLFVILSKISVPHIWELIVAGFGFATVFEMPRNKGMIISVLSLGLLAVLNALLSILGSAFGG